MLNFDDECHKMYLNLPSTITSNKIKNSLSPKLSENLYKLNNNKASYAWQATHYDA